MNPESAGLLEQLRDIHAAPAAPWWPPAPGWWLVAAVLACALFLLLRRVWRALQVRQRRRRWLDALCETLAGIDPETRPQAFLAAVNRLFKGVALRAFPAEDCAGLQGPEWVAFLREKLDRKGEECKLAALAEGPYRPRPQYDAAALEQAARAWIRHYG